METAPNYSDFEAVNTILTLRYNPLQKPLLPKLSWSDLSPSQVDSVNVESTIINYLDRVLRPSKKQITVSLSGGIDSTLMLAILKKNFPDTKINAISLKFPDSVDETTFAQKIASHFDVDFTVIFLDSFLYELPKAISIVKQPFWDLHWYHIAKNAKKTSDYLLSGDGGDELFGGYSFRYEKFLCLTTEQSSPKDRILTYLKCHERDWVPDQEALFGTNSNFSWKKIHHTLLPYFDNSLPLLEQVLLADYNGKLLYNFSPNNAAINEFFGIVGITPLLSNEMIKISTQVSAYLKYDKEKKIGKMILRKLLSKYVDDELLFPKKQGFSIDTVRLWESNGRRIFDYYFDKSRIIQNKFVNRGWVDYHLSKQHFTNDVRYVNKFLGLLAFEIWYRIFITREMDADTKLE